MSKIFVCFMKKHIYLQVILKRQTTKIKTMYYAHFIRMHWREYLKAVLGHALGYIGMLITLFGSLAAIVPHTSAFGEGMHRLITYIIYTPTALALVVILILLTAALICLPKTRIVYKDHSTDIRIIIEQADIMRQTGLKVIHCVDTFDMSKNIISPESLHGAFIRHATQNTADLELQMAQYLTRNGVLPGSTDDTLPGRKIRYPLGTVIPVDIAGEQYCLAAFTHLQSNGSIAITKQEYIDFLKTLWHNLALPTIRQETINVAVMGNRFVDLPAQFSTEQKIDLMLQTFFLVARERACCRTLRICVHPNNVGEVDFTNYATIAEHLAKRPVI